MVSCWCGAEACADCWKQWISSSVGLPVCMGCKVRWTDATVVSKLGRSYYSSNAVGGFRAHYKLYVTELEKAHREQVALVVGDVARARRGAEIWSKLGVRERTLEEQRMSYLAKRHDPFANTLYIEGQISFLEKALRKLKVPEEVLFLGLSITRVSFMRAPPAGVSQPQEEKREVLCACPYDGCSALVIKLDGGWRCLIDASHEVCGDCLAGSRGSAPPEGGSHRPSVGPGGTNHRCDPNDLETVKSFKGNTKPCPKCGALIFRTEGCVIMWCTACNNGFDWKTGEHLPDERVHNPHFTEYMASRRAAHPARPTEGPLGRCDGEMWPDMYRLGPWDRYYREATLYIISTYINAVRWLMAPGTDLQLGHIRKALDLLHFKVLTGEIDETTWAKRIFLRYREISRVCMVADLAATAVELLRSTLADIRESLAEDVDRTTYARRLLAGMYQMEERRDYINRIYHAEGSYLGISKSELINESWQVTFRSTNVMSDTFAMYCKLIQTY